ncbi:hypothetical protein MMC22_009557 [Lobaria immixta]|nr:hypothetical protein [Lobaria immixta]
MPTLTQEQANAKFAIEQRRAEAEVAAIEAATARERAAVGAKTARDNDESQARIAAMAVGRTTTADPNTRKDTEESVGSLDLNSPPPGFDPPPQEFIDSIQNVSYAVKTLLWYGLYTRIRQGYDTAISLYTLFCATRGVRAWPASELILTGSNLCRHKTDRSDITFAENDQHAIERLKRSKSDLNRIGVEIILAATHDKACPVTALRMLFTKDPQPRTAPLFRLTGRSTAFDRDPVINILQKRLQAHDIYMSKSYTGHSFRKDASQDASDNGMLDQHIQKLGRWTSQAFQLYFYTSASSLYTLSKRFQTGQTNTQPSPSAP